MLWNGLIGLLSFLAKLVPWKTSGTVEKVEVVDGDLHTPGIQPLYQVFITLDDGKKVVVERSEGTTEIPVAGGKIGLWTTLGSLMPLWWGGRTFKEIGGWFSGGKYTKPPTTSLG